MGDLQFKINGELVTKPEDCRYMVSGGTGGIPLNPVNPENPPENPPEDPELN